MLRDNIENVNDWEGIERAGTCERVGETWDLEMNSTKHS